MKREEAEQRLREISGWVLNRGGNKIERDFTFKDFKGAMDFVNKAARVAESEGHHPDIYISWNRVHLALTTHAINGLSENDFIMAAKLNLSLEPVSKIP